MLSEEINKNLAEIAMYGEYWLGELQFTPSNEWFNESHI